MLTMKLNEIETVEVYEAHMASEQSFQIEIEWEGGFKRIIGREDRAMDVQLTSIELATRDSVPSAVRLSPESKEKFKAAVKSLLEGGECFYTCLRNSWNIPSFRWEIVG